MNNKTTINLLNRNVNWFILLSSTLWLIIALLLLSIGIMSLFDVLFDGDVDQLVQQFSLYIAIISLPASVGFFIASYLCYHANFLYMILVLFSVFLWIALIVYVF